MFGNVCGGKIACMKLVELLAVLRHADGRGELALCACAGSRKNRRIEHRGRDFAHAVGAEVEAQHAVAVAHAAIAADHGGHDELVELLLGVGVGDRRLRDRESAALRPRRSPRRPCRRAPSACRDPSRSSARRRLRPAPTPAVRRRAASVLVAGRLRRRIAAVGEGVHERRHAGVGEDLRQRGGVVLVRMHAARRDQPDQVAGAAALLQLPRSGR